MLQKKKFHTKDFDSNLIIIADRPIKLIYEKKIEKKKVKVSLMVIIPFHKIYYVRSCRHVAMETLRRIKYSKSVAAILDFEKTFDKVPHQRLSSKVIQGSLLNWFESFLTGRYQTVVYEGEAAKPRPVISGVPPGNGTGAAITPFVYKRPARCIKFSY